MGIPGATYRVQFNRDFRFSDARLLVSRLHRLGITHLYASPVFEARACSTHGYDVVDPNRVSEVLGGWEGLEALAGELKSRDMGLILDIVPNHMAASWQNAWWMDVLEHGPASRYASFFGIRWGRARDERGERIVLPILGCWYAEALERGEIRLTFEGGAFFVNYHSHKLPLDPSTYPELLGKFPELPPSLDTLPPRSAVEWEALDLRQRETEAIKRRLMELENSAEFGRHVAKRLRLWNEDAEAMHGLLERQAYRLAFWKVATERVGYRRFFDVSDLVGVRVQDPAVLEASHALIFRLLSSNVAQGLRVDHIDGMFDPRKYLDALPAGVYKVVEKILTDGESLPESWPVDGTTGYDFLGIVNGLYIAPSGLDNLTEFYHAFTGAKDGRADVTYERRKFVARELFAGEMKDLGDYLGSLSELDRRARDLSQSALAEALLEVTVCLPVYRTYINSADVAAADREHIQTAVDAARQKRPDLDPSLFHFIHQVLGMRLPPGLSAEQSPEWLRFVMRWQQITGPIMAKGVEDSAMYVYNALLSLNEVGGIPRPVTPEELHSFFARRRRSWPQTMNATSTHDTKRSEGVRSRLNVLAEMPGPWRRAVSRWRRWMQDHRQGVDANEEYFVYQTVAGAWPLDAGEAAEFRDRLRDYMVKAVREARVRSSWLFPDEDHERELLGFADALFDDARFRAELNKVLEPLSFYGCMNALSQLLIKATAPGVPDFYQGTVGWNFALVDPDNRRPAPMPELTDFDTRLETLLSDWRSGRIMIFLTEVLLGFRKAHSGLFREGDYIPLEAQGSRAAHIFAFARRLGEAWAITAAPRLCASLSPSLRPPVGLRAWHDTRLLLPEGAPRSWKNAVTNERLRAQDGALPVYRLLRRFPAALVKNFGS